LIVDDGLHTLEAGITFFEGAFRMLASHGIYIIEDVRPMDVDGFCRYFAERSFQSKLVDLAVPGTDLYDNKLLLIRNRSFARPPTRTSV
jgi:hypothetical protein